MNSRIAVMTLALVLLTIFATAFAMINFNNSVIVWPLTRQQPLTLVIGIAFGLGAGAGALLISLLHHKKTQVPAQTAPTSVSTVSSQALGLPRSS
jgi:hypothetical protein